MALHKLVLAYIDLQTVILLKMSTAALMPTDSNVHTVNGCGSTKKQDWAI